MRLSRFAFGLSFSRPELLLIFITFLWGGTFLLVKNVLDVSGPFFFVGVRFAAAAAIVALLSWRSLRNLTWLEAQAGMAIGVAIALGYTLQTVGLGTISSSKSAFLTALYVPAVPLLQWLVLRRRPGAMAWVAIALAFVGLVLLSNPAGMRLSLGVGEIVTLAGAIAIAAEVILIGRYASRVDTGRVTVVQLAVASLLSFAAMLPAQEAIPGFSWLLAGTAVGLGALSAAIQSGMNWAQKTVSPTRATVIYAGEPVWAGIVGRLAGERLPGLAILGAALIVAGIIVSERKPFWHKRKTERAAPATVPDCP